MEKWNESETDAKLYPLTLALIAAWFETIFEFRIETQFAAFAASGILGFLSINNNRFFFLETSYSWISLHFQCIKKRLLILHIYLVCRGVTYNRNDFLVSTETSFGDIPVAEGNFKLLFNYEDWAISNPFVVWAEFKRQNNCAWVLGSRLSVLGEWIEWIEHALTTASMKCMKSD